MFIRDIVCIIKNRTAYVNLKIKIFKPYTDCFIHLRDHHGEFLFKYNWTFLVFFTDIL